VFIASWVQLALVVSAVVGFWIREWYLRWRATDEEVARPIPGDPDLDRPSATDILPEFQHWKLGMRSRSAEERPFGDGHRTVSDYRTGRYG
jgi:hypothetical protein